MTHPDSTAAIAASPLSLWERGAGGVRSYPAYLDSGIPWLGSIPAHWQVKRLRFVCRLNPSRSEVAGLSSDAEISFLPMEAIGEDGALDLSEIRIIGQVGDGYTYFRDGDVLVAKITPCFENGKGALCDGLTSGVGFGTTELHVIRPNAQTDAKYIFYVTQSHPFREFGAASMKGAAGQQRVPEDFIKDFQVAFPPLAEQRAIAAYLDRETTRLDALVAAKERLIALLREKRAALISRAVTRGLDPAAPMKDSGVSWLGQIPAHWQVKRLKTICSAGLVNGLFKTKDQYGSGVKLINVVNLYRDDLHIDIRSLERVQTNDQELRSYAVLPGDIFFVRSSLKLEGVAASALATEIDEPTVFECHIVRARIRNGVALPAFVIRFLNSSLTRQRLVSIAETTTMTTIGQFELGALEILVPPIHEQYAIAAHLDRETAKLDALVAAIRRHIEKVKEYRAALIAAAVTGKIDVRETKHEANGAGEGKTCRE